MGWRRPLNGSRAVRLVGLGTMAAATSLVAGFLLLPLAVRMFVRALLLTSNASVWFAASLGAGVDAWTILATIGRAAGSVLISTELLAIVGGLALVGALALYGLQRLLGSEQESSR
jgi:hypothetical protein